MATDGDPSLLEDVVKLLEKLPSIIEDVRHSELWTIDLGGDDDKNTEIVVRKFLEQHSILPLLQWRRDAIPRSYLKKATEILTQSGLQYIMRVGDKHVMWVMVDENTIRSLSLLYEEFLRNRGLTRVGIAALENLTSVLLTARDEQDSDAHLKATCVVQFRPSYTPDIRSRGRSLRENIRDNFAKHVLRIQRYYPGLIGAIYVVRPSYDYLANMDIPENLLRNTTILQRARDLAGHLGADIPPEYGGTGMTLSECDCLKNMYGEPIDEPAIQEALQKHPLSMKSGSGLDEKNEETASFPVQETTHDTKAAKPEPEPALDKSALFPERLGPRHVRVDSNTIVKYGPGVRLAEAEAMHLVSTHTSIPIPKLFSAYSLYGTCYIIMSDEKGEPFSKYWDRNSERKRQNILGQLQDYVAQMRSMKGDFIGGINLSPCKGSIFIASSFEYDDEDYSYGPYASEEQFTEGIVQALQDRLPSHLLDEPADPDSNFWNTEYTIYQTVRQLPTMGHTIVFTHGDLHPGNMLVRSDGTVVILHWDHAGYWPDYWEYYRAMSARTWRRSWDRMVEEFVPPFYIEYAILRRVFITIWK
ncbi:phosphotransferase enzyme family protein-like protein [Aspergillus sclerotioniger CBS 115572]|uniref:Phosphotransferase enzyme family protein-like protein n=1 Tax=Aspergillus sclerotioniger CBS 115572 TaxID=1450535 RepID=A0A317VW76_9EURO|nr:phosphotransferase enzyme family protein-like protein [Aspergillus sclerotioniger CBS 115572]PWY77277.1 phosphotransferase enzyme family protein-like protein [Aspergillus sclerotioniger CBS 115572]